MKILHLTPGSGGTFYCQNCLRDHLLIRALRRQGHDVVLAPLYLPMYGGAAVAETNAPMFFGGIGVYLREKVPFLRRMPGWLDRALNSPFMLRKAAKREGTTNASDLGPMTISMLEGREGNQRQEFERFRKWIETEDKPDIVHISNALLLGFIPALQDALDAVFVCSLQDEEPWVNDMKPPYDRLCWEAMTRRAQKVHSFVSTSQWYAGRMTERMQLQSGQIRVIYPGVEIPETAMSDQAEAPVIGYLSRLNAVQGFEALVTAFIRLKKEPAFGRLRLRATGGITPADTAFVNAMERKLRKAGVLEDVEIDRDFQSAPGAAFFGGLTVMSAPVQGGEAFGMHIIEAMARGIPVVQPSIGAYPEIIGASGGGLLYEPRQVDGLTDALRSVLADPALSSRLGRQGYAYAHEHFRVERMARDMAALYEDALTSTGAKAQESARN